MGAHGRRLGPRVWRGVEMNFTSLFSSFTLLLQFILNVLISDHFQDITVVYCHPNECLPSSLLTQNNMAFHSLSLTRYVFYPRYYAC